MEVLELYFNNFHISDRGQEALLQLLQDPLFAVRDLKPKVITDTYVKYKFQNTKC
jgi:hypothetical protein